MASLFTPNNLVTNPRTVPTRTAAIIVPTPTEPRRLSVSKQEINEIVTILTSNPIFTLLKRNRIRN